MSLEFDLSSKSSRNFSILQRALPSLLEIRENIPHVAVYKFNPKDTKWMRFNLEGPAFVVRCYEAPYYQFIILNKEDPQDFYLDISKINKIKVQPPYLMIQFSTAQAPMILGIWFHDEVSREKMTAAVSSAVELTKLNNPSMTTNTTASLTSTSSLSLDRIANSSSLLTDVDIISRLRSAAASGKSARTTTASSTAGNSAPIDIEKKTIIMKSPSVASSRQKHVKERKVGAEGSTSSATANILSIGTETSDELAILRFNNKVAKPLNSSSQVPLNHTASTSLSSVMLLKEALAVGARPLSEGSSRQQLQPSKPSSSSPSKIVPCTHVTLSMPSSSSTETLMPLALHRPTERPSNNADLIYNTRPLPKPTSATSRALDRTQKKTAPNTQNTDTDTKPVFKAHTEGDSVRTRIDGKLALLSLLQLPTTSTQAPKSAELTELLSVPCSIRSANAENQQSSTANVGAATPALSFTSPYSANDEVSPKSTSSLPKSRWAEKQLLSLLSTSSALVAVAVPAPTTPDSAHLRAPTTPVLAYLPALTTPASGRLAAPTTPVSSRALTIPVSASSLTNLTSTASYASNSTSIHGEPGTNSQDNFICYNDSYSRCSQPPQPIHMQSTFSTTANTVGSASPSPPQSSIDSGIRKESDGSCVSAALLLSPSDLLSSLRNTR